jgi:N6-adenosine-specific RNA methylase IME4
VSKLPISKIKVRNRYRKCLGDIAPLAASIKELGLLHPIVARPDGRLIAGERRLAACKRLGWKTIPVTYVDLKQVVRGEFAENAFRKDFLPSEIEAIRRALEPYEKEAAKERQRKHGGTAPGRRKHSGKLSRSERTRDRIGAFAGVSGRSLVKIQAIVEAAERNPKRFAPLVADMDRNGRIDAAYRKLRQMQDEEQTLAVKPLNGKFKTLCIDPPWTYSVHLEKSQPTYSTMSQRELLGLPINSWADEQAHCYLWTTNTNIKDAFELMEAWEFKFVTMLTWVKPSFGLGTYFRTTTEHVLFGVRGRLLTRVRNIGTHFIAPKTHHSAKPDVFYQMVERSSYPPYLDAFARKRRPGWTVWGNGIAKAA